MVGVPDKEGINTRYRLTRRAELCAPQDSAQPPNKEGERSSAQQGVRYLVLIPDKERYSYLS